VSAGAPTAKGPGAEVEVMGKSGLNILVPAFRLQCFVHLALLEYIIKNIGLISEGGDYLLPEGAWK